MPWPIKNEPVTNYTEEPVCIVSKEDLCVVWAGAKVLFSGAWTSGDNVTNNSGYNFRSGETDVEPISHSGWGRIRVPEMSEVHFALVTPKAACVQAAVNTISNSGHVKSGIGGISGNVMLLQYCDIAVSGPATWLSGTSFISGIVDVVAFGSRY